MFPVWSHWTATMTRKGRILWTLHRILKAFAVLSSLVATVFLLRNGRGKTMEGLKALLERPHALLKAGLQIIASKV